jgi:serine/threonine protein kinase
VVKVLDFGIAKIVAPDRPVDQFETQAGTVFGTPRYMSPEQVAGRPVDHRSDIFSLGTVLYELLTGTRLFAGNDATEIMYNVSQLRPVPPSRINRQVPAMLDLVVAKALEKDADERYQNAHQFADDLRACLAELGVPRAQADRTERLDQAGGGDERTRTLRIDGGEADAAVPEGDAPRARGGRALNIIVDSNTRLALSHVFDSAAAVKRLTDPAPKDHARLTRAPQPPGLLTRCWRDPELRALGAIVALSAVAGVLIAAY